MSKTNAVGRQRPRDKGELIGNVGRYLWSTQRRPKKVRRYCRHPASATPLEMPNTYRSP